MPGMTEGFALALRLTVERGEEILRLKAENRRICNEITTLFGEVCFGNLTHTEIAQRLLAIRDGERDELSDE